MRNPTNPIGLILRWSVLAVFVGLAACTGTPTPVDTTGMTAPKLVQLAQAAADRGEFDLAQLYYQQIRDRHPADTERVLWATYEIAFLHHKMGNDPEAIRLLGELIDSYGETPDPALPQGPLVLARKIRANLEEAAALSAAE